MLQTIGFSNYPVKAPAMTEIPHTHRIKYWREKRGLSQKALAERAGMNQQKIHLLENQQQSLRVEQVPAIARALGVKPVDILPEFFVEDRSIPGEVSDVEAEPFDLDTLPAAPPPGVHVSPPRPDAAIAKAIDILIDNNPDRHAFTLRSRALELEGYKPGDILIIDMKKPPRNGEIVCAQIYAGLDATTVFRQYMPPFLLPASRAKKYREPLLVDNMRVKIMGTVIHTLRPTL